MQTLTKNIIKNPIQDQKLINFYYRQALYFHSQKTENDFKDETVSFGFSEQEICKATADTPVIEKQIARSRVKKDVEQPQEYKVK